MERFERAIDEELDGVTAGRATFKAVRGEYGAGKTFFARWLAERAKRRGMAAAEVQISETETPLHKLETVYRRLVEQLSHRRVPAERAARDRRCLVLHARRGRARRGGRERQDDVDALADERRCAHGTPPR